MLNTETKRRIDNARDILVGKVPDPKTQVEQITFAMIYKFMDDMDQLSVRLGGNPSFFANGYEQYAWSKLMDRKISGADRLDLYVRALDQMAQNPHIPQLFRDVFKGAFLPYRDSETLNLFLKEMNGFTYDHSEDLGDAYEYLLSIFATQGKAGQFRTPRHIIDFIVDCVDPDLNDTVLDPACGTAGFLISAYKHILEKHADNPLNPDQKKRLTENFVGYDISPDMVRLSRVNMYLHQFPNPTIFEYDTLTTEDRWDDSFDVILANPPFMTPKGGIRPHKRFAVRANRSEVLFVDYIAEHLNVGGRAGVIVPEGIIFQSSNAYKALRKMLVEENYLYAVVSLPAGIFQPYSGVKTSVLLVDKELAKGRDSILFVKVENDGYDLGAQRNPIEKNDLPKALEIIRAYRSALYDEKTVSNFGLVVKKEKLREVGDYYLSGDRYAYKENLSSEYPTIRIGDIIDLNFGVRITKRENEGTVFPVYGGGGESFRTDTYNRENEVVISRFAMSEECVRRVSGKFYLLDSGFTYSIREDHKQEIQKRYLDLIFLNYQQRIYSCARGHAQLNLDINRFKNLTIPLPPLEVQQEIVDEIEGYQKVIDGARQVVENYKPVIHIDPAWPLVKLGEVATLEYGHNESGKDKGDTRFVRITDISDDGDLLNDDPKFITLSKESQPYLLKKGDVVVARTGATYGKTLYFESDIRSVFAGYLIRFHFEKSKIVNKYFFYFSLTQHYQNQKEKLVTGGGQPQFNAPAIKQINIPLPDIKSQERIIEKIAEERRLIKNNNAMIELFTEKIESCIKRVWENV